MWRSARGRRWCSRWLVWPLYDRLGNRVEPRVFGLPLAFAWNALLAGATFLVLAGYFALTEPSGGPKGRDPGSEDQGPGGGEA